jgi:hypothetical protein
MPLKKSVFLKTAKAVLSFSLAKQPPFSPFRGLLCKGKKHTPPVFPYPLCFFPLPFTFRLKKAMLFLA